MEKQRNPLQCNMLLSAIDRLIVANAYLLYSHSEYCVVRRVFLCSCVIASLEAACIALDVPIAGRLLSIRLVAESLCLLEYTRIVNVCVCGDISSGANV